MLNKNQIFFVKKLLIIYYKITTMKNNVKNKVKRKETFTFNNKTVFGSALNPDI